MADSLAKALGRNLRRHRFELGLTQEGLAEILGFHPTYVGELERGTKNPSLRAVEAYANALDVEPRYLLRE